MYQAWVEDPTSVHKSWADAFSKNNPGDVISMTAALAVEGGAGAGVSTEVILDHLALQRMIRAYRVRGHHRADIDPLGLAFPGLKCDAGVSSLCDAPCVVLAALSCAPPLPPRRPGLQVPVQNPLFV